MNFLCGVVIAFIFLCMWQLVKEPVFTWIRINLQGDKYKEKNLLKKASEK
jgi:hypothetical protein